jgi:arachidonate 15-lipoxygenase
MPPSIPQQDPRGNERAAALAKARERYQFTFANNDIGFARSLPRQDALTPRYLLRAAELQAKLKTDLLVADVAEFRDQGVTLRESAQSALQAVRRALLQRLWGPKRDPRVSPPAARVPETLSAYGELFQLIEPPRVINTWQQDVEFAWQQIAGTAPVLIEVERRPDELPEHFSAVFDRVFPDDTFAAAQCEGRLFRVDFQILDGIQTGITNGYRKFLSAPILHLVLEPSAKGHHHRRLLPLHIQLDQHRTSTNGFTPEDGAAWQLAKATVQVAYSNYHGVVQHLTRTHIVTLNVALATYRSLAPEHPVRVLLHPHFQYTLPLVNDLTQPLFLPGGKTTVLQSTSSEGAIELIRRSIKTMRWNDEHPPNLFERRGTLDASVLPEYPFRDDAMPLWDATQAFVERYIRLYYASDADVREDWEVQAWVALLQDAQGARLNDLGDDGKVVTIAALVRLVTQIIWRVTTFHNVINYSVFDAMGYVPNMPTASYAPPPVEGQDYAFDDLRAVFPPLDIAKGTLADVYVVGHLLLERFGHYPAGTFEDSRVLPLVAELQRQLGQIEYQVEQRNRHRRVPFEYLLPSRIANSIQV